jgi:hypothetical protein
MATINKDFRVKNGLVVESGSITTPLTTSGLVLTNSSGVLSSTSTLANSYLTNSSIVFGSTAVSLGDTVTNLSGVTINSTTIPSSKTLLVTTDIGTSVQAWDSDLDAIAALTGTTGFLKKTASNTWALDTNTYLTSGSAAGSVANSLILKADTGTTEGTDLYTFNGSVAKTLDIKAGSNITISKSAGSWTISTSAGIGTVTSVGLSLPSIFTVTNSPVTGSGTLTATLASQTQNYVFAAPSSGAGAPTFRALVSSDIPTLNQNTTGSAGSVVNALSVGATLAFTTGTTFDGSAARTLNLASGVVTTGTYTKVTVDTYGRVTTGATLSAGDIPDISSTYLTTASASSTYLTQTNASTTYAPKASPTFTGTVTTPLTTAGIVLTNSSGVLSSTATIADSYLATISTAGKVSNSATTATNNNTASAIVARDASGNFNAGMISLSGTTTNATDVATKAYVDNLKSGFNAHDAVEAASTTDLTTLGTWGTVTYTAGTTGADGGTGVGATLTPANNGAFVLDNTTLDANDRVLIKNQSTQTQNGIYVLTSAGSAGSKWTLTRATDYDNNIAGLASAGDLVFVAANPSEYTTPLPTNLNTGWTMNAQGTATNQAIKFGTDNLTWVQFSGAGTVTAGTGITVTGNSVAIDTSVTVDKTTAQTLSNKTFVAPVLGAATATSLNGLTITSTTGGTLTIPNSATLALSGGNSVTLTSGGTTNVTLPTTGTLATLTGAESLTNKKLGSLTSNGLVTTSGGDGTLSVTTMGTGIATFLSTPTSANLAAALTNETGTGTVVFSDSATLTGTPVAPTASFGTNSTQLATTAYADAAAAGNGTTTPNVAAVNYNSIAKNISASASITGNTSTVISGASFATGTYSSAEYLVKTNYATDSEISKVLVTINYPAAGAQPNVYITEYSNVQSNTTLSTITATVTGSTSNWTVNLQVTPTAVSGTTTVKVYGTLLAS